MTDEKRAFWDNFLRAVETEPRPTPRIYGASGIQHSVLALGVDDARKRLVIISGDHDARASAMMQTDIQSTLPGTHVVVARPIAVGLPIIAQRIIEFAGMSKISAAQLGAWNQGDETGNTFLASLLQHITSAVPHRAFEVVPLDILSQILYIIRQLTYVDIKMVATEAGERTLDYIDLATLATQDLMTSDREVGVCPLPLYTFKDADWGMFESHSRDDLAIHLKSLGIFQYFFPAPDQAVLGLIDRANLPRDALGRTVEQFRDIGHPVGEPELVRSRGILEIIDELQDKGLVVEGKADFTLTEAGNKVRATVAFKPRESALSKLINQLRLSVNISNYFK
jgi:hypothetical protein